jgi:hypothetical protein
MFVRKCPYVASSARVCFNQLHWLPNRMREEGVDLQRCSNAFVYASASKNSPIRSPHLVTCGQKWLARLTPFFTAREREQAGCQHRLFFSQTEFCDNLIFHRRDATADLPITRPNCATISARATWANTGFRRRSE